MRGGAASPSFRAQAHYTFDLVEEHSHEDAKRKTGTRSLLLGIGAGRPRVQPSGLPLEGKPAKNTGVIFLKFLRGFEARVGR
jgi:hypothetical protein